MGPLERALLVPLDGSSDVSPPGLPASLDELGRPPSTGPLVGSLDAGRFTPATTDARLDAGESNGRILLAPLDRSLQDYGGSPETAGQNPPLDATITGPLNAPDPPGQDHFLDAPALDSPDPDPPE